MSRASLSNLANQTSGPVACSRTKLEESYRCQAVQATSSLQNFQNFMQKIQRPTASVAILQYLNETDTCHSHGDFPSLVGAFVLRKYKEKFVRDVCVDTHDLLNEPGGIVMNLTRHASPDTKLIKIHLGIHQKSSNTYASPAGPNTQQHPGTLTTTDDYAREIFRSIKSNPDLKVLYAVLELKEHADSYELKTCPFISPDFLRQFIQTYPTAIAKLHVEIPGINAIYLPEWKFLLEQQTVLQELICNFGVVLWNYYENCISKNSNTLTRIVLRRLQTYDKSQEQYTPMNWEMFSNCKRLVYLKVTCGYKKAQDISSSPPPTSVFLHKNLNKLPMESLTEIHLSKIWIEKHLLQDFCAARPSLMICLNCNDMEYYDGDRKCVYSGINGEQRATLITVSSMDLRARFLQPTTVEHPTEDDQQIGSVVLGMFLVMIASLTILFIIVYVGNLRGRGNMKQN